MRATRWCRTVVVLAGAVVLLAACGGDGDGDGDGDGGGARAGGGAPPTVQVATFPSITRLTPNVRVDGPDAGTTIALEAARGEREGGQLAAWISDGSERVVLETGRLAGPRDASIGADAVTAYIEQSMVVEHGSPAGRSGTYVDPLVPAAERDVMLGVDERLLAWVDVAVPLDAAPGTYVGEVRIRRAGEDGQPVDGDDGVLARVPVQLVVRRATLPHVPTLASHVGFDASQVQRFEEIPEGDATALRDVTERYAGALADARLSIGDVGTLPPGALPGHAGVPGDGAYLERVFSRRGVASVRLPFYVDYPFSDPFGADRAAAVAYLRRAYGWASRNGWADRAYVFAIDEPDDSRAGEVRELHELVKDAHPALRLLVTREASARSMQGSVDIWAPNINPERFRQADVVRVARAGRDTWWYPSITTWQPYPTLFIDELRPTPRALGWLAWQRGIDGFLYWTATHWHEVDEPYRDPGTYNETSVVGNGDGVLLYPGGPVGLPGTPVPSVRLLQLRDGIEDHDLLTMAACDADAATTRRLVAAVRLAAPALDSVDPTIEQVRALRSAAFDAIDARASSEVQACTARAS